MCYWLEVSGILFMLFNGFIKLYVDFCYDLLVCFGDWCYWYGQVFWQVDMLQLVFVQYYVFVLVVVKSGMFIFDGLVEFVDGVFMCSQVWLMGQQFDLQVCKDLDLLQLCSFQVLVMYQCNVCGEYILCVDMLFW